MYVCDELQVDNPRTSTRTPCYTLPYPSSPRLRNQIPRGIDPMQDRSDLEKVVFGQTRVVLTRDLSVMNPNLVAGSQGLVIGKLATYTLKVAFPNVSVGINWQDCDIVEGKTGMPTLADQPRVVPKPRTMGEE